MTDKIIKEPRQFAIAESSNGTRGLITSKTMVEHKYPERTVMAWTGIIIGENRFKGRGNDKDKDVVAEVGGDWSSSNPTVLGYVKESDILALIS